MADLEDVNSPYTVDVSTSDLAGNPTSNSSDVVVDTSTGTLVLNEISSGYLNAAEVTTDLTLTGTTTGIEAGQIVSVEVNGQTYTGNVASDGSFGITIPATDLNALGEQDYTFTASVSDVAGNTTSDSESVTVDLTPGTLNINDIDYITAQTHGQALEVSGTSDLPVGTNVEVSLNGQTYTGQVDASGEFSVTIPASDVANLNDTSYDIQASAVDLAGNETTALESITVDTVVPTVQINPISDGYINLDESSEALVISGTTTNVEDGQSIVVNFNNVDYTGTVNNGSFSIEVPASVISSLGNNEIHTTTVTVSDVAGNETSATQDVVVDLTVGTIDLTIDEISGGAINIAESTEALTITGTTTDIEDGNIVTVTLNGIPYTGTVLNDVFSVTIPSSAIGDLDDGVVYKVEATVSDNASNDTSDAQNLSVDLTAPSITLNEISNDVLNIDEHQNELTITGTTSGVEAGELVSITLNGETYTGAVDTNGNFGIIVPATAVSDLSDASYTVIANVSDAAGNPASSTSEGFTLDLSAGTITIDTVSDNYINASEHNEPLVITGSTTDIEAGQIITVTINGVSHQATVDASQNFEVIFTALEVGGLVDGDVSVEVSVSDIAGNEVSSEQTFTVDTSVGTIIIDDLGDNIINSSEQGQPLVITGTTVGIEAGQAVSVTLNNKTYPGTVDSNGDFTVTVPVVDMQALSDDTSYEITVSTADQAGNAVDQELSVSVDLSTGTITLDEISDDYINASESNSTLSITGTTTGIEAGQTVNVEFNSITYTSLVQADGSFSVSVPVVDVQNLADGNHVATASVSDAANNATVQDTEDVNVDTSSSGDGAVTVNDITADDIINAAEATATIPVSGTVTGDLSEGTVITFIVNSTPYTATVLADNTWSVDVAGSDLALDTDFTITATGSDVAGNPLVTTVDSTHTVDTSGNTVTLDLNSDTGSSSVDGITSETQVNINGLESTSTWEYTLDAGTTWVEGSGTSFDLAQNTSYTQDDVQVRTTDGAGNTSTSKMSAITTDDIATNSPIITDVVDTNSDLSSVVISGTGTEVGNTIKVYDAGNSLIGTAIVSSNLTWSITTTFLSSNQEYAFRADETDIAGNISSDSNIVTIITTTSGYYVVDASTDYILGSSDDNIISVEADDLNNSLVIDGGEGNDTVSFRNLTAGTTIDMNAETNTIGDDSITLLNIEDVYGSEVGDDTIIGNAEDNLLYGGGGNDVLHGGDGDDYLLGDQGALKEDNNDDILYGDAGNDTLVGGHGNDTLYGGDDDDSLHGQRGDDRLIGGAGDDNIRADGGIDTVVFSGNLSDYTTVKISSTQFTITDIRDGSPDGTDTVSHAEFIEFADQTVSTKTINAIPADLVSTSDTGLYNNDNVTSDTTPTFKIELHPNAVAGCKSVIYVDNVAVLTTVLTQAQIDATFIEVTLPEFTSDGEYAITTSLLSLLGLEGNRGAPLNLEIDAEVTAPILTDVAGDVGTSAGSISAGGATNDATPTFNVTLGNDMQTGYILKLYDGVNEIESYQITQVDIDAGTASITPINDLSETTHVLSTTITNKAGVESSPSATFTFSVDASATPLILDLDGDGVETISKEEGTLFDIDADGDKDKTGWVGADDGLLVRDINKDGIINDASELFGEHTIKDDGSKAKDGFDALSELDSNNDGVINQEDDAFDELQVWKDLNSDGITNDGELISLAEANIKEISLENEVDDTIDNGNTIGLKGTYTNSDGEEEEISDVWFSYEENMQNEAIDLNLSNISNSSINLKNSEIDIVKVDFNGLIDKTNDDDELIILGDANDKIILDGGIKSDENEDGIWEEAGTKEDLEGNTYNVYQSTNGTSIVKLLIDEDIDVNNF